MKNERIVFLDLMRFIALLMMIQGHTIFAFLDKDILEGGSHLIYYWRKLRGFTAPFFLLIAGTIFTYLLLKNQQTNLRIKKGFKRAITLIFWGYLLRFPFSIFSQTLSETRIQKALSVDVLHLIGFGLFLIIAIFILTKKAVLRMYWVFFALFLFICVINPFIKNIDFAEKMPFILAAYLNDFSNYSNFPLVPWLSFILAGCLFGIWLFNLQNKGNYNKKVYLKILALSALILFISELGDFIEIQYFGKSYFWKGSPNLIFHRIGFVLLVGGILAFIGNYIQKIPKPIAKMSQNTLWLYIAHLILIYWIIKPNFKFRLNGFWSVFAVIIMLILMILLTRLIEYSKKKKIIFR